MITGIWIGAIIGYIILIFMYGRMYEQTLTDQVRMQTEISELERQNKALLEDKEDLEEKSSPDRKSTRLNSSHVSISYAVFCLKKKSGVGSEPGRPQVSTHGA